MLVHQLKALLQSTGPLGMFASSALIYPLTDWWRKNEFTADRAGFIACRSVAACQSAEVKLIATPSVLE